MRAHNAMPRKYDKLGVWLKNQIPNMVQITISDLEKAIGISFPPYVHKYPWGNDKTQGLARTFMSIGYVVSQPNVDKEVLLFKYNPSRASQLLAGNGNNSHHRLTKERRSDVPTPSKAEVEKYLHQWDSLESYHLQENALDKLFFRVYPSNTDISDILIKVSCLNDFYSTNIFSPFSVAKHILSLNVDERLKAGDPTLVQDIAMVTMENGKTINFYSFATKYCSHHRPLDYAIWDSFVDEVLRYFRDVDGFTEFESDELKDYPKFRNILLTFKVFYGISEYSLKDLDRYLWQLGKDKFPQKRYQSKKSEE